MIVHNVRDARFVPIVWGSWNTEPLDYSKLTRNDIGRSIVFTGHRDHPEVGTLTSFRNNTVFARFTNGSTAAGCNPAECLFTCGLSNSRNA